ncbi:uncharacterized protein Dana_GF27870 [Drosophila ananassae]|uniref:Uncharacterized protein n=1 Tax=Drosophila ananassae TaxID=7217 RepID=A0A0P8XIJ3_DROAN|nr:uncharacterized protein LOC26515279 [Drosophila ananassae]KPU74637.1 uncharacterized protein Dana_GF27870 [Drosophila ananassae]
MASYTCTQFLNLNESCIMSSSTTFTLDAVHFAQKDLNLFIESLETISRLEKQRYECRQRQREHKLQQERIAKLEDERCRSPTPSAEEAVDEPILYLEAKCIPYAISDNLNTQKQPVAESPEYYTCNDEAYGSATQSPRSSITYCSCGVEELHSMAYDSAESGVYGTPSPPPVRPRSQVITKSKRRSTRSRIINMVLKRDCCKTPISPCQSHKKKDKCVFSDEIIRGHYEHFTSRSRQGIAYQVNSPEESFLNKALRYLTL